MIVTPAPDGFDAAALAGLGLATARTGTAEDGLHAVLADDMHRLWFPHGAEIGNAAVLVPLDGHLLWRVKNLLRLTRHLLGQPAGPWPREQSLSRFQLHRAALMLRAWDGVASGASRRQIASVLLNRDVETLRALDWKNAPERRRLARILKTAHETIEGGYLRLLARPTRHR
nr:MULTISPECIES: DUF2285 domain-containing protein [unclassified Xanthobacter]